MGIVIFLLRSIKLFLKNTFNLLECLIRFVLYGTFNTPKIQQDCSEIFILGNGPSLFKDISLHIDILKQKDILMVNQALTTELAFQIKPKFYCLMDPIYWCPNQTNQSEKKRFLQLILDLENAFAKITWNLTIFVPYHIYKNRDKNAIKISNPLIKIQIFNTIELYTFKKMEKFLYTKGYAIPSGINVLIASLCCAITMKYEKIYLLGADSDWHTQLEVDQKSNQLYSIGKHFYDTSKKTILPHNISFIFSCISQAFFAYEELASLGFPIYNLSSNSMIDAFPRDTLNNILNKDNTQ